MLRRPGFSLIELLLVVVVMGILSSIVIAEFQPNVQSQLESAAQIAAAELETARGLAVNYGSKYKVTFDKSQNQLVIQHSGTNAALDTLPPSPFQPVGAPATQRITDFDDLPQLGARVKLQRMATVATTTTDVTEVEFTPLGATTSSAPTSIWLTAGTGSSQRYLPISIDAVTGMATVGATTAAAP